MKEGKFKFLKNGLFLFIIIGLVVFILCCETNKDFEFKIIAEEPVCTCDTTPYRDCYCDTADLCLCDTSIYKDPGCWCDEDTMKNPDAEECLCDTTDCLEEGCDCDADPCCCDSLPCDEPDCFCDNHQPECCACDTTEYQDCDCDQDDPPKPGETVSYANDIQPIWNKHCTDCHNSNGDTPNLEAGASYENIINDGYITTYNLTQSTIYYQIESGAMPDGLPRIPQNEIDLVMQWLVEGYKNNK